VTYLLAALLAPILGPVLYGVLHTRDRAMRLVDGFVYLAVPALVAVEVVPYAWRTRSVFPFVLVAIGLAIPTLFERASRALEARTDDLAIVVALSGIGLHALLEGTAFGSTPETIPTVFVAAVTLHRVPVGLVIWWLIRPRHGTRAATTGIAILLGATLAGYLAGSELLGDASGGAIELYQAFVSGSLIHVVFHQGRHDHQHEHRHDHAGPGESA
jgi:hypothetical protein